MSVAGASNSPEMDQMRETTRRLLNDLGAALNDRPIDSRRMLGAGLAFMEQIGYVGGFAAARADLATDARALIRDALADLMAIWITVPDFKADASIFSAARAASGQPELT